MDDPIWPTTSGAVRGRWVDGCAVFLGIPYAAPPFGANRFRAPAPPVPWTEVRDALDYSATAPQPHRQFTLVPEPVLDGEDCLSVNVFTPELGPASLPVLVWIHGGGFVAGCSASPWYDGKRFARDGVVVVSLNYRLGIDGFLPIEDAPPNRGVLDWVAALRWVRDNIAGFGGDPTNVTIAGQSAGGVACGALLAVPEARGLFHRAVLQSGAGGLTKPEDAAKQRRAIEDELGVPATIDALAALPIEKLLDATDALGARRAAGEDLPLLLGPVVDGDVVTHSIVVAMRDGVTNDVDLIVGVTSDEFNAIHLIEQGRFDDDDRFAKALADVGLVDDRAAQFVELYPGMPRWKLVGQSLTDRIFRASTDEVARTRAEVGAPVFAYEFRWPSPAFGGIGASHCMEIPFVFDNLDADGVNPVAGDAPPQALADAMHAAWVDFITKGDAGWPRYELPDRTAMVFDDPPSLTEDPWAPQRSLWPGSL